MSLQTPYLTCDFYLTTILLLCLTIIESPIIARVPLATNRHLDVFPKFIDFCFSLNFCFVNNLYA